MLMKSQSLIMLMLCMTLGIVAYGQTDRFEAALFTKMQLAEANPNPQSDAQLRKNFQRVDQYYGTHAKGTYVEVQQSGNHNTARVTANAKNSEYIVIQDGDNNTHVGSNKGIANRTLIDQYGQGNTLVNRTTGKGVVNEIQQGGQNNYLEQNGQQEVPMTITQRGAGMKVIVNGR